MSDTDTVFTDVLIIGGGPSGLAMSIHLANLLNRNGLKKRILLVDKGNTIGQHILSGAIIRTNVFKELLPDVDFKDIPFDAQVTKDSMLFLTKNRAIKSPVSPPYMGNKGNHIASLGKICQFLAEIAEQKGVEIYPGFAVNEILYKDGKVSGAKTIDTGVDHFGNQLENFQAGTKIEAKLTVFAEGVRGNLSKELIRKFGLQKGKNPQIYSLGCKELWSVPKGNIDVGRVYNTLGYPMNMQEFGGGFIYGLADDKVAVGIVIGLDYADPTFDIHAAFQVWKSHPAVNKILKGGKLLEYGAKTLPEGGYYSLPKLYVDNALIVGDSAGFLVMPALKGIDLAIRSGMSAAETAFTALEKDDFSEKILQEYETKIKNGKVGKEMYRTRNFRQGFLHGLIVGAFHFGCQIVTGGAGFFGRLKTHPDSEETRTVKSYSKKAFKERFKDKLNFDKITSFDKATDVYYSGVHHDEQQVVHLQVNNPENYRLVNIQEYDAPCQYFCPAEVYELHTNKDGEKELRIHAENCLHCKTCDIKEPADGITWNIPNGGNGPDYKSM